MINQVDYEKEVLDKWGVDQPLKNVMYRIPDEEDEVKPFQQEDVKQAQAATGALLWLSTRSRPDIAVHVNVMSRLSTKDL